MIKDIYLIGEVGYDITIDKLIKEVEGLGDEKEFNLYISSEGGSLVIGKAIYTYLKKLQKEGYTINTYTLGLVASMGTIIFLGGTKGRRNIHKDDVFYLHLPTSYVSGTADDLEKQAEQLKQLETEMATIYSNESNVSVNEALELMKNDNRVMPETLQKLGFVDNVLDVAYAKIDLNKHKHKNQKQKSIKMSKNTFLQKFMQLFGDAIMKVIQTTDGKELVFADVDTETDVKIGDTATIDGEPATGTYLVEKDGKVYEYVFDETGTLTAINEKQPNDNEIDTLKEQINQISNAVDKLAEAVKGNADSFKNLEGKFNELGGLIKSGFDANGKANPFGFGGGRKIQKLN